MISDYFQGTFQHINAKKNAALICSFYLSLQFLASYIEKEGFNQRQKQGLAKLRNVISSKKDSVFQLYARALVRTCPCKYILYMRLLFSSFLKKPAWFDSQTNKVELYCDTKQTAPHETPRSSSFSKNGHTACFDPQTKTLKPHCITNQTAPHESTV